MVCPKFDGYRNITARMTFQIITKYIHRKNELRFRYFGEIVAGRITVSDKDRAMGACALWS